MKLQIHRVQNTCIAELISQQIEIFNVQDSLDLMANAGYLGADKIIVYEQSLTPEFFKLSTCLAGDILQKFSNYKVQLAIVGDFSKYTSKSLKDFIYESNKRGRILFMPSLEIAISKLIDN
ncbi:MAG: DUF4180 domain-containing protein [Tenuifilaceae bacterium]